MKHVGSLTLFLLSVLLAWQIDFPLSVLLDLNKIFIPLFWAQFILVIIIAYVGVYLFETASLNEKIITLLLPLILSILLLSPHQLDDVGVVSLILASVFVTAKPEGISGVWKRLREPRGVATLFLVLILAYAVFTQKEKYNEVGFDAFVELMTSMGEVQSPEKIVNQIIPQDITDKDRRIIIEKLSSLPEWNLLTSEQRERVIQQSLLTLKLTREALRETMLRDLRKMNVFSKEKIKEIFSSMKGMRAVLETFFLLPLASGLFFYSLTLEIISILLFIIILPIELLTRKKSST